MATMSFEIINGVLWVSGNLDRVADHDFQTMLEQYSKSSPASNRVIDMSHVRWLAPSSAKILIQWAQVNQEKDNKLRVLASRHAMQTLNLLGAKTWLTIESSSTPTAKPGAVESPGILATSEDTHAASDITAHAGETSTMATVPEHSASSEVIAASSSNLASVASSTRGALATATEELTHGAQHGVASRVIRHFQTLDVAIQRPVLDKLVDHVLRELVGVQIGALLDTFKNAHRLA